MAPISITLTFDTPEQAQHVLEAYSEARGMGHGEVGTIPAFIPAGAAAVAEHVSNGVAHAQQQAANFAPNGAAAAAAPSTSPASTTELDERGVPWHVDHHSSSKKQSKGKWDRRRGHNKAAADAYEAQYVGKPGASTASAAPAAAPSAPRSIGPSADDLVTIWSQACQSGKVFDTDQTFIQDTWKVSHPIAPEALADTMKRSAIYAYITQKVNA